MIWKGHIVSMFILVISLQTGIVSQTIHCSNADAEKADYEASRARTWDKLYHSYLHYSGCDDGSIGEGYSDSVVGLLAYHWDTLPQAFPLFSSDAGFHKFALKHIDSTTKYRDLKMVRAKAIHSCPAGGSEYCVQIRKAAENALRDQH